VKKFPAKAFFSHCRTVVEELGGGMLNLEGVCFRKGWLHFFHRGNISGTSVLITLLWKDFLRFQNGASSFLADKIQLPTVQNIFPGISGATLIPETNDILFTASLEQTENVIDDGVVMGSMIGILRFSKSSIKNPEVVILPADEMTQPVKLESIAIQSMRGNEITALCVSDMEQSTSQLLEIKILRD
jgi:hypothetical protein